ncbi:flagellar export protein FliJ [Bacillus andreraoultii]|uniref:flagellar export protein FliJ n=1 Tax=Bacillus andreraoultii TaxID=1499685 RepID=UPI00053BAE55|nr:flagellar export protein FliJ [Bacillus andreraoultii]
MKFNYKLQKVLELREREKEEQAYTYEKSIRKFEEVAEFLYERLKQKETLEGQLEERIKTGVRIQEIRMQQKYLMNLEREIDYYQKLVFQARNNMQLEKQVLVEKNIEVKKMEKMKNKEYEKYIHILNMEDRKVMDELSMQIVAREK